VQGVVEKWLFSSYSRSFGYGFQTVRIRFKDKHRFYFDLRILLPIEIQLLYVKNLKKA
jgi:hypothetical protein